MGVTIQEDDGGKRERSNEYNTLCKTSSKFYS